MISKTCGYAIRGVVFLSLKNNGTRKLGIGEIADELQIPQHFLGKILQDLVRKGIINSIKGPNGGFYINKSTLQTSILDIIEAVDGLGVLKKCFLGREECSEHNPCPLHFEFDGCRKVIFKTFKQKSISQLVDKIDNGESFLSLNLESDN